MRKISVLARRVNDLKNRSLSLHIQRVALIASGKEYSPFALVLRSRTGEYWNQKNASVRISMLSRGRAFGGALGSSKAVCALQRARPSFSES
ncbi:hypothetical protein DFP91_1694 [Pseudorhodoplanes sinuspersici]|nr:hypothetical protein DFP91_1694 [Pseudorhodoplanes sinuspersici]